MCLCDGMCEHVCGCMCVVCCLCVVCALCVCIAANTWQNGISYVASSQATTLHASTFVHAQMQGRHRMTLTPLGRLRHVIVQSCFACRRTASCLRAPFRLFLRIGIPCILMLLLSLAYTCTHTKIDTYFFLLLVGEVTQASPYKCIVGGADGNLSDPSLRTLCLRAGPSWSDCLFQEVEKQAFTLTSMEKGRL